MLVILPKIYVNVRILKGIYDNISAQLHQILANRWHAHERFSKCFVDRAATKALLEQDSHFYSGTRWNQHVICKTIKHSHRYCLELFLSSLCFELSFCRFGCFSCRLVGCLQTMNKHIISHQTLDRPSQQYMDYVNTTTDDDMNQYIINKRMNEELEPPEKKRKLTGMNLRSRNKPKKVSYYESSDTGRLCDALGW